MGVQFGSLNKISGDLNVSGDIIVTGASTLKNGITVTGNGSISGTMTAGAATVNGAATLKNGVSVTGNGSISGTMTAGAATVNGATALKSGVTVTGNETVSGSITQAGQGVFDMTDFAQTAAWTGVLYMSASQSVDMSAHLLNNCKIGWILCWQKYDPSTSTVSQSDFQYHLVPKWHGANKAGYGIYHSVPVLPDSVAHKYIYVDNNSITGNDNNSSTTVNSGLNRNAVLTAVIPV